MSLIKIALANVVAGKSLDESLAVAEDAIVEASSQKASIVCFPESYIPGYRVGQPCPGFDIDSLTRAWARIDSVAGKAGIAVILGTERFDGDRLLLTARVTNPDGTLAGFQDKVQLDPSEEGVYSAGSTRRVFKCGLLTFGIVICHEGWRYPETVRWAVRNGAQVVFHPHTEVVERHDFFPAGFADPANSFHEKAALCRAAENTCYFATVNNAIPGASTTSAIVAPDGSLLAHHPYGESGILLADLDLSKATGYLANRLRPAIHADTDQPGPARSLED